MRAHTRAQTHTHRSGFAQLEGFKLEDLVLHELRHAPGLDAFQLLAKVLRRFCSTGARPKAVEEEILRMGDNVRAARKERHVDVPFDYFCAKARSGGGMPHGNPCWVHRTAPCLGCTHLCL